MSNLIKLRSPKGLEENHTPANATDLMNNAGWVVVGPADAPSDAAGVPDVSDASDVPAEEGNKLTDEDTVLLLALSKLDKNELIDYAHEKFGVKIKATFSVPNIKAQIVGLTEAAHTQLPPMNTSDGDNGGDNGPGDGGDN